MSASLKVKMVIRPWNFPLSGGSWSSSGRCCCLIQFSHFSHAHKHFYFIVPSSSLGHQMRFLQPRSSRVDFKRLINERNLTPCIIIVVVITLGGFVLGVLAFFLYLTEMSIKIMEITSWKLTLFTAESLSISSAVDAILRWKNIASVAVRKNQQKTHNKSRQKSKVNGRNSRRVEANIFPLLTCQLNSIMFPLAHLSADDDCM